MASRAQPPLWRETMKAGAVRSGALIAAIALFAVTIALGLALGSYHSGDPSLSTAAAGPAENLLGYPGAIVADLAYSLFGRPVWLMLGVGLVASWRLWKDQPVGHWVRMTRNVAIGTALVAGAMGFVSGGAQLDWPAGYGGLIGMGIAAGLQWLIALIGDATAILWTSRIVALAMGAGGLVIWALSLELGLPSLPRREPREAAPELLTDQRVKIRETEPAIAIPRAVATPDPRPGPVIADRNAAATAAKPRQAKQASFDLRDNYPLPSLDLLKPPPAGQASVVDKAALERNARLLETVLDDFHVKGNIVEVHPGPVVTLYELEPAAGTKASRVTQLADDIARNMSAVSARIATIPSRTVIGIELPNVKREMVSLYDLVASDAFEDQTASLPIILGKNIAGDPVVVDLAPMPHLLVAGTTGSGKSVGLNCMILSLLYKLRPDQCRMIMIDPKMLELSMYEDIPHLLSPVVTDPAKAVRALKWAVEQMEDRYRQMSSVGVRSLASFNDKIRAARAKGQPLGRKVQVGWDEDGKPIHEEEQLDFQTLPQIVIIVDELADLMMTAGKEVEFLIQRLAQKARAAGIHLIMATQRPSVDVITGVIKANLPTRISFHVTSKIDSRTILGEHGAEQLLGKGDMLLLTASSSNPQRIQGPWVSEEEVRAVAAHWKRQRPMQVVAGIEEVVGAAGPRAGGGDDGDDDELLEQAMELVVESQKASTSWLQRQMRIGYNSAARLIERMEKDGIVGRPDHVGRREVLRDRDGNPV